MTENSAAVVNAAIRVLGCAAEAEDVAQEVFIEAFQKFDPHVSHSWAGLLRRMAVCRSLDLLRAGKRIDSLEFQPVDSRQLEAAEELSHRELHEQLRTAVAQLPKRESEVFCLACFERMSHDEVATALDISVSAVSTLLSKARARLSSFVAVVHGESQ